MDVENSKAVGKFIIVKDLKFSDFMKDEKGIVLYDSLEKAADTCGMYEFEDVLVCQVVFNHKES